MHIPTANDADATPFAFQLVDHRTGRPLTATPGTDVTVGKSRTCGVPLPDDENVSRQHCRISGLPGDEVLVEDLNSSNGTYIRIKGAMAVIRRGDVIVVGRTALRVD